MSRILYFLILSSVVTFFLNCSSSPTTADGGSSLGNGKISASVVLPNGTPAKNASIRIRPSTYVTPLDSTTDSSSLHDIITNNEGRFTITKLDTGYYTLEIHHDSTLGKVNKVALNLSNRDINLGTIKLDSTSIISGSVPDTSKSYRIRVFGLEGLWIVNRNGTFRFRLPNGSFDIQVVETEERKSVIAKGVEVDYQKSPEVSLKFPSTQWTYMKTFTLNTTLNGAALFQNIAKTVIPIRLYDANLFIDQTETQLNKFLFLYGKDTLNYELELVNQPFQAIFWVSLDTLFGNSNTQKVTMLLGKDNNISNQKVFTKANGFETVWHMSDVINSSSVAPYTIHESSEYGLSGQGFGNLRSESAVLAGGIDFDGEDGFIRVPHSSNLVFNDSSVLAISLWFKLDKMPTDTSTLLLDKSDNITGWRLTLDHFETKDYIVFKSFGYDNAYEPFIPDLEWHNLLIIRQYGGEKINICIDGKSTVLDHRIVRVVENNYPLYIGGKPGYTHFTGIMDAIMIRNIRSITGFTNWQTYARYIYESQKLNQSLLRN